MMPTALEAGTLNAHGIAGLNAAVSFLLETGVEQIHAKEMELVRHFLVGIKDVPQVRLYGDVEAKERTAIVSLNIGEMDAGLVSDILWEDYGICVRAGAHCAPLVHKHFGTEKQGMVRFSFGYFNTLEEVDVAIKAVKEIAEQEQE
jgi:selenocysteine lyase/cysteine desulfurase